MPANGYSRPVPSLLPAEEKSVGLPDFPCSAVRVTGGVGELESAGKKSWVDKVRKGSETLQKKKRDQKAGQGELSPLEMYAGE